MDFAADAILSRLTLGAAVGFAIGLTGVGGGVLIVPALAVVLRFPPTLAVGTAAAYGALAKIYATFEHLRLRNVDTAVARWVLVGGVPGAALAALFIKANTEQAGVQHGITVLIIATISVSAVLMAARALRRPAPPRDNPLADVVLTRVDIARAVVIGAVVGLLVATTAAGGGVILMPALVFAFPMAMRRVVGSAVFVSLILTSVTGCIYLFAGKTSHVDVETAFWMVVGSLAGVRAGARLSVRFSDRTLVLSAVAMITVAAIAMTGTLID